MSRFGLTLLNRGVNLGLTTSDEILDMADRADATGVFKHVWVGDQIMAKPRMESITLMAGIDILLRFPSWDQSGQFERYVNEVLPHLT